MMTTIQFRIDSKTKREATKVFKSYGMDLSTALRMFLMQVIRVRGLPFSVTQKELKKYGVKKKIKEI